MPIGYLQAFALSDNPFGPKRPLPGIAPRLMQMLERRPLLLHKEQRLQTLYCDAVFAKTCLDFQIILAAAAYVAEPPPPSRGSMPHAFLIQGDRGTGKTTLASQMIRIVARCTGPGDAPWKIYEAMLDATRQTATEQLNALATLEKKITDETQPNDYCCVLVDDFLGDVYPHVLAMFDRLSDRIVFLLLVTGDFLVMADRGANSRHGVKAFTIDPISPGTAVAFVRQRLDVFRPHLPANMAASPLFPFDEDDLLQAVSTGAFVGGSVPGPVTLRLLSVVLHDALQARLTELARTDPTFDVQNVSAGTVTGQLITVAEAYRIMVAA